MKTERGSDQEDELDSWATGRLLSTAARLVEHAWDAHLGGWRLNHSSFVVLWVLAAGPSSQRTLATRLHVEEQTMSRMVERLERDGYVVRKRSTDDRRRMQVTATAAGLAAARAAAADDSAEQMVMPTMSAQDLAALRKHLITLVSELGDRRWA